MQFLISFKKLKQVLQKLDVDKRRDVCRTLGITTTTEKTERINLNFKSISKETAKEIAGLLLETCKLTANQLIIISSVVGDFSKDLSGIVFNTAKELYDHLRHLELRSTVNIAVRLGSRSYPANLKLHYDKSEWGEFCSLVASFTIGSFPVCSQHQVHASFFSPPVADLSASEREPVNLLEWLDRHKLSPITQRILEDTASKLEKLGQIEQKKQMICIGQYIDINYSWFGTSIEEGQFGSITHPEKVITESNFELGESDNYDRYNNYGNFIPPIPLIRVFSLRLKKYLWVDVADLDNYIYDLSSIERLVLPQRISGLLTTIFSKKEELFADVVSGKHGGMVILAVGKPGVGKTLTAEIMSEYTERPLYVMELGELGTNLVGVEESLNKIFKRVSRWNALLLFDEADIFLHQRDNDLERSAIVGIFLRLLDYFPGVMFLTTNRSDVIDHAVKSRVTIKLEYPDLSEETRAKIWRVMFNMIKRTPECLGKLPSLDINGRQIRNLMRLAVSYHGKQVTPEQIYELSEFMAK